MRYLVILLLCVFLNSPGSSQECSPYFNYVSGQTFQMTNYNNKDKVLSTIDHEVINVEKTSTGGYKASFKSVINDQKGEEISTGEYGVACEEGVYSIEIGNMINQDFLKNYENMEFEVEGNTFDLPKNISEGQALDDLEAKIKMVSGGASILNMTIKFTERKIEEFKTITTPAGEFDCVVMSYMAESKLGFIKTKLFTRDYFAKKVGLVLSESLDKKKKKIKSRSVLTKLSIP